MTRRTFAAYLFAILAVLATVELVMWEDKGSGFMVLILIVLAIATHPGESK